MGGSSGSGSGRSGPRRGRPGGGRPAGIRLAGRRAAGFGVGHADLGRDDRAGARMARVSGTAGPVPGLAVPTWTAVAWPMLA